MLDTAPLLHKRYKTLMDNPYFSVSEDIAPLSSVDSTKSITVTVKIPEAYDVTITIRNAASGVSVNSTSGNLSLTHNFDGLATVGEYDVEITMTLDNVTLGTQTFTSLTFEVWQRRAITILHPLIALGSGSVYNIDQAVDYNFPDGQISAATVQPGSVIRVSGNPGNLLTFRKFIGTEAEPIRLVNDSGKVQIYNNSQTEAMKLEGCRHFHVLGMGDSAIDHGLEFQGEIRIKDAYNGVTLEERHTGMHLRRVWIPRSRFAGACGIINQEDTSADDSLFYKGHRITHNIVGSDTTYLGPNTVISVDGLSLGHFSTATPRFRDYVVHSNYIYRTEKSGMLYQSMVDGIEIFRNLIERTSQQFARGDGGGVAGAITQNDGNHKGLVYQNMFLDCPRAQFIDSWGLTILVGNIMEGRNIFSSTNLSGKAQYSGNVGNQKTKAYYNTFIDSYGDFETFVLSGNYLNEVDWLNNTILKHAGYPTYITTDTAPDPTPAPIEDNNNIADYDDIAQQKFKFPTIASPENDAPAVENAVDDSSVVTSELLTGRLVDFYGLVLGSLTPDAGTVNLSMGAVQRLSALHSVDRRDPVLIALTRLIDDVAYDMDLQSDEDGTFYFAIVPQGQIMHKENVADVAPVVSPWSIVYGNITDYYPDAQGSYNAVTGDFVAGKGTDLAKYTQAPSRTGLWIDTDGVAQMLYKTNVAPVAGGAFVYVMEVLDEALGQNRVAFSDAGADNNSIYFDLNGRIPRLGLRDVTNNDRTAVATDSLLVGKKIMVMVSFANNAGATALEAKATVYDLSKIWFKAKIAELTLSGDALTGYPEFTVGGEFRAHTADVYTPSRLLEGFFTLDDATIHDNAKAVEEFFIRFKVLLTQ